MKKIIFSFIAFGCIIISLLNTSRHNMKSINEFLKSQVDNNQTPSIQYAFFDTGGIIFEKRYGLKNIKSGTPIDASSTYHLYSVTKTFTALSVLQLAQEGIVELNKPVSFYLPLFPYQREITVEHLLSHTSGIPNPLPLRWIHLKEEHSGFDHDKFFAQVFEENPNLDFKPGSKFKYSNLGYVILGQLVEKVTGQPLKEYIEENIINRSGIEKSKLSFDIDSTIHTTGYHKYWSISNAIFGFLFDKQKFMGEREGKWKPFHLFYNNGTAYGGMFGSASGLIKYAQTLIRPHSILLNDKYKQLLFTEKFIHGKPTGMSLSWYTGMLKGNQYFSHAGGGGGYYIELRVYPQLSVGSVILYNRSGMKDERLLDKTDAFFITANINRSVTL